MTDQPPVALALSVMGIPYTLFQHQGPISSLEQAASQRGQSALQVIRSLLFRLGEGSFVMVLMAGPAQVSWSALRSYLGQSRLTLASEAEVLAATGYLIGAVSPLGLPSPLRILADESVFAPDEISIGSGLRGTAVIMRSADLRKALPKVEIGRFASTRPG
jgi:prolyl-tRNA editing enzyme YbaK/EbsC (Cys-tRNA(Pro) deacylase)